MDVTTRRHLHRDDVPRTLGLVENIIGTTPRRGFEASDDGAWVNWEELADSSLSSTEIAAVRIAQGCEVLERRGGLPPHLYAPTASTVKDVGDFRLGLIGRDRVVVENVGKLLHSAAQVHSHTPLREARRGNWFEVLLADGYVVRVSVELDRIDPSLTADG